jgi:hypothetical protein
MQHAKNTTRKSQPPRSERRSRRPFAMSALLRSSRELSWPRLLAYLRPYRWWMAAAIGAMLVATSVSW